MERHHTEEIDLLRREVGALADDERSALTLRYYSGMTYEEVADVLCVPQPTVVSRIQRGMERLKARLTQLGLACLIPSLEQEVIKSGMFDLPPTIDPIIADVVARTSIAADGAAASSSTTVSGVKWFGIAALIAGAGYLLVRPAPPSPAPGNDRLVDARETATPQGKRPIATTTLEKHGDGSNGSPPTNAAQDPAQQAPSIAGIVTDDRQQPLADVKIILCRGEIKFRDDCEHYDDDGNLLEGAPHTGECMVETAIDGAPWRETTSGAGGEFAFNDLAEGMYRLKPAKRGYLPQIKTFFVNAGSARSIALRMGKGVLLSGSVEDESGNGVGGVPIRVYRFRRESTATFSPGEKDDGLSSPITGSQQYWRKGAEEVEDWDTADIACAKDNTENYVNAISDPGGRYSCMVRACEWSGVSVVPPWYEIGTGRGPTSPTNNVRTDKDCEVPPLVVHRGTMTLSGRVINESGSPVNSMLVEIRGLPGMRRAYWSHETDDAGGYVIGDILPGTYEVGITRDSNTYQWVGTLELKSDRRDYDITVPSKVAIRGRILGAQGERARYRVHVRDSNFRSANSGCPVEVDDEGGFTAFVDKGRYSIQAEAQSDGGHRSFSSPAMEIDIQREMSSVDFYLKEAFHVAVTVIARKTESLRHMRFELLAEGGSKIAPYGSDGVGRFSYASALPGQYTLRAFAGKRCVGETVVTVADANVDDVTLTVDEGLFIHGQVLDAGGKSVAIAQNNYVIALKRGDEYLEYFPNNHVRSYSWTGEFGFMGLDPGDYVLEVADTLNPTYTPLVSVELRIGSEPLVNQIIHLPHGQ